MLEFARSSSRWLSLRVHASVRTRSSRRSARARCIARDTRLDRIVAVKMLPEQFAADPQFRERFEREARLVASLNHAHICTLHDVGRHGEVDFLVMEHRWSTGPRC